MRKFQVIVASVGLLLLTVGVLLPPTFAQEEYSLQGAVNLLREHVTNEATRVIAEIREIITTDVQPSARETVVLESIRLRVGDTGGHPGHERQSLLVDINPQHAMVQCTWEAWGGVQLFPGNRSAYLNRTPSRGDGVRVDCVGIYPYARGSKHDTRGW